jgi:hypothetical protein
MPFIVPFKAKTLALLWLLAKCASSDVLTKAQYNPLILLHAILAPIPVPQVITPKSAWLELITSPIF